MVAESKSIATVADPYSYGNAHSVQIERKKRFITLNVDRKNTASI